MADSGEGFINENIIKPTNFGVFSKFKMFKNSYIILYISRYITLQS